MVILILNESHEFLAKQSFSLLIRFIHPLLENQYK